MQMAIRHWKIEYNERNSCNCGWGSDRSYHYSQFQGFIVHISK